MVGGSVGAIVGGAVGETELGTGTLDDAVVFPILAALDSPASLAVLDFPAFLSVFLTPPLSELETPEAFDAFPSRWRTRFFLMAAVVTSDPSVLPFSILSVRS